MKKEISMQRIDKQRCTSAVKEKILCWNCKMVAIGVRFCGNCEIVFCGVCSTEHCLKCNRSLGPGPVMMYEDLRFHCINKGCRVTLTIQQLKQHQRVCMFKKKKPLQNLEEAKEAYKQIKKKEKERKEKQYL